MPQSPVTTNDLIVNSYYLVGELSPDELPKAKQIKEGLFLLNDLLDSFSADGILIPFTTKVTFNLIPGKADYVITNKIPDPDVFADPFADIEYVNVIRDDVSYPVRIIPRANLYNNTRILQVQTRPGLVVFDRQTLYTELQFYPTPGEVYECNVRGKAFLDELELQDTLDEVPRYYYRFLRYALARELSSIYPSNSWTPQLEKEYDKMLKKIESSNDIDMTINPDNILMTPFDNTTYWPFGIFNS